MPSFSHLKTALLATLSLSSFFAGGALAQRPAATTPSRKPATAAVPLVLGQLTATKAQVVAVPGGGKWGLAVRGAGLASAMQPWPVELELYQDSAHITREHAAYDAVKKTATGGLATATVTAGAVRFRVEDQWTVRGDELRLARRLTVLGNGPGGFLSAITLGTERPLTRQDAEYFAPGMIYGSSAHLTKVAIGGSEAGNHIQIREDRLPAPLFGLRFPDGSSLTVLDPAPDGSTTKADSYDRKVRPLVDERFRFGALGAYEERGHLQTGFWWPGTEGETTYEGRSYPGGQLHKWRLRYHPLRAGLVQQYRVTFRFAGKQASFADYYPAAWRWAWQTLQPKVTPQDIELARRSLIDMLGERVETRNGVTGITNWVQAAANEPYRPDPKTVMGFTGKTLESANFLLQDADRDPNAANGQKHRQQATALFDQYVKLKVDPPAGEGFNFDTGQPELAIPQDKKVYLRSFTDDMKATAKALLRERKQGREHDEWLAWITRFADWLLTQQQPAGGFPRSWAPGTGQVADASPQSTYNAVPFLLLMSQLSQQPKYQQAALRAAEFSWNAGQASGVFVGGTIDNPDVIDKEAGTLSVEAYLALFDATKDARWLAHARTAANYAETWIYLWNMPIPADDDNPNIGWKKGVPTVGLQLISSGHSLVDLYMAFDVDEYAKLSVLAKDPHYYDVARLLLHDTKQMLALPGRLYDLRGPGWQQEHWSLAPERGYGQHRGWLPWVSTSHLNGIFGLEEYDPALYKKMIAGEAAAR